jgi:hypothetical protein
MFGFRSCRITVVEYKMHQLILSSVSKELQKI